LCLTPILHRSDLKPTKNKNGEIPKDYREAIKRVVRERQKSDSNLHLVDGLKLINDPLYLWVTDVVHPNDAGFQRMAEGVAVALKTAAWKFWITVSWRFEVGVSALDS
jgi:lysophospholipase L1-like esterase